MIAPYAELRRGLVGAWCPSVSGGALVLPDLGNARRNATVADGGVFESRGPGSSRALRGRFSFPYTPLGNRDFTVSAFLYPTSLASYMTFFENSSREIAVWLSPSGNVNGVVVNNTGYGIATLGIAVNRWWHVAVCRVASTNTWTFFRNGIAVSSVVSGVSNTSTAASWQFGTNASGGGTNYSGFFDDARVYSRALADSEVATLASSPGVGLRPQRTRRFRVGSQFWLRDAGTWKKATPWIKVNGVWTKATPKLNVSGTWK